MLDDVQGKLEASPLLAATPQGTPLATATFTGWSLALLFPKLNSRPCSTNSCHAAAQACHMERRSDTACIALMQSSAEWHFETGSGSRYEDMYPSLSCSELCS